MTKSGEIGGQDPCSCYSSRGNRDCAIRESGSAEETWGPGGDNG